MGARSAVAMPGVAGETSAAALLARHARKGDSLYLFVDLPEENYSRSEMPRLWSGQMREQLLDRRLVQQYPDLAYRAAVSVGGSLASPPRLASLVGLGHSYEIDAARSAAVARGLTVVGMWPISLPLALCAWDRKSRSPFLLTVQLPGGVRHVLAQQGVALFSRLSQAVPGGSVSDLIADAQRTAQYLSIQGWRKPTDDLLVSRIWHSLALGQDTELPTTVSGLDLKEVRCVEDFYALALGRGAPPFGQLLPATATLQWRARQFGQAIFATGVVCVSGVSVWAVNNELQSRGITAEALAMSARAGIASGQTAGILAKAKGDLQLAGLAQAAVASWLRLVEQQPDHASALMELGSIMSQFPDLRLERVAWRAPAVTSTQGEKSILPDTGNIGCTPLAVVGNAAPESKGPASNPYLSLRLLGQLPSDMPLRRRLDVQNMFTSRLEKQGWHVELTKPVIERGELANYAGVVGELARAEFEVCISIAKR
jgi:hypothetical protein